MKKLCIFKKLGLILLLLTTLSLPSYSENSALTLNIAFSLNPNVPQTFTDQINKALGLIESVLPDNKKLFFLAPTAPKKDIDVLIAIDFSSDHTNSLNSLKTAGFKIEDVQSYLATINTGERNIPKVVILADQIIPSTNNVEALFSPNILADLIVALGRELYSKSFNFYNKAYPTESMTTLMHLDRDIEGLKGSVEFLNLISSSPKISIRLQDEIMKKLVKEEQFLSEAKVHRANYLFELNQKACHSIMPSSSRPPQKTLH